MNCNSSGIVEDPCSGVSAHKMSVMQYSWWWALCTATVRVSQ